MNEQKLKAVESRAEWNVSETDEMKCGAVMWRKVAMRCNDWDVVREWSWMSYWSEWSCVTCSVVKWSETSSRRIVNRSREGDIETSSTRTGYGKRGYRNTRLGMGIEKGDIQRFEWSMSLGGRLNPLLTPTPLSLLDQLRNGFKGCTFLLYRWLWLWFHFGFGIWFGLQFGGRGTRDIRGLDLEFVFSRFSDYLPFRVAGFLWLGFRNRSDGSGVLRSSRVDMKWSTELRIDIHIDIPQRSRIDRRWKYVNPNSI